LQGAWIVVSLPLLKIFGRKDHKLWYEWLLLALEWINWGLSLVMLEGFSFTISDDDDDRYCRTVNGGHDHSPQCNAIYAGIAIAGVELILFSITVGFVTYILKTDYKNRKNLERISSDISGEPEES
jgi:hypothetical protein